MIPKISRGQKLGGLLVYLFGPGDANEHRDRHIVAGSPTLMRTEWLRNFDGPADDRLSRDAALAIAREIEIPRRLYGTQARMRAKPVAVGARGRGVDVVEPAGKGEKGEMRDAPVWHCILALEPGEDLDDARFGQLAEDFMERMGFTGTADGKRAQARWVAVRHGKSGAAGDGQEHIHIAASLIREDGSRVNTFDYGPGKKGDRNRAQQVANELEHAYGLRVLASRERGGGISGDSRAEIRRAQRIGAPESERERLRRIVRAAATGTDTEAEFVKSLRELGISIRPRYAQGDTSEVTGYSVRFRRDGAEVGPWLGGGKLAGDLTLTALREQQWNDSATARDEALAVWRTDSARRGRQVDRVVDDPQMWRQAATEIGQWREAMAQVPYADRAQWAWMAGQAAGVFASWSEVLEGDRPGVFAAAHKELMRSAQVPAASQRYRPRNPGGAGLGGIARVLLEETFRDDSPLSRMRPHRGEDALADVAAIIIVALLLLLLIAIAIAGEIARAHRARGELDVAVAIEQATRYGMEPVRANWEAVLTERRYRFDRNAADVFAAASGRRSEKALDALLTQAEQATTIDGPDTDSAAAQLGAQRLAELTAAAEELVPGVADAEAWPVLRARLAAADLGGRDAIAELTAAVELRELGSADDIAAVLIWRLDQLDTIAKVESKAAEKVETSTGDTTPTIGGRGRDAVAAANGPLTPPAEQSRPPLRRKYYTEMSEDEREMARMRSVVDAGFARHDLAPETWNDARLTWEIKHRRAEAKLLADEIEARRREGGPHTRAAVADNAVFAARAEKILAAQKAEQEAKELEREKARLEREKARLQQQLEETSKFKPGARKRFQDEIDTLDERLDEVVNPAVAQARESADAAADATGRHEYEWSSDLHVAQPHQQRARLKAAAATDERALSEDDNYLYRLQRNLARVEREHARRESLTPEKRAAEEQAPRVAKRRSTSRETGPSLPGVPPTLGHQQDRRRDQGPEL
ncbi:hypothetical protein [Nocardia sp. 852002-51244_SCH5132740]|uniref:relaxase/mobilization nuclease domain-containing protein n=1 Tax=Nocardia sp. 852002-51244_SCH5132740 TaxID=1834099 RepID=UPI0007EAED75|nr:hypothetical protein [Nocardia sp. 852002-51244_SCH5132740]OBB36549.1 hypothetical protein A5748_04930 [Nocardia sp. 852002-51244_SCH5132740]